MKFLKIVEKLKTQKGSLLLSFLFIIIFIGTFWGIATTVVVAEIYSQNHYINEQRAFYAAESGIEYTRKVIVDSSSCRAGVTTTDIGAGTFTVTIDDKTTIAALGDTVRVTSVGTSGNALKQVVLDYMNPYIVLFIVPNAAYMNSEDLAKKAKFESFGYTVKAMSDHASQAEYDEMVENSYVVYISENVWSYEINTRLRDKAIPVMYEEHNLGDDFGLLSGEYRTDFNSNKLWIQNNSHYISSPFPLGFLTICNSYTSLTESHTNKSPSATELIRRTAASPHKVCLVVDTGDLLVDGTPAPARRIAMPWGGDSFSFASLNSNGETLLRRSFEWCLEGIDLTQLRYLSWKEKHR